MKMTINCDLGEGIKNEALLRKPLQLSREKLLASITTQLELFLEVAQKRNVEIDHIKAHGALYNALMEDMKMAETLVQAREKLGIICPIFALCRSTFYTEFHKDIPLLKEAFADRKYTLSYRLASRQIPNSVIEDPQIALGQYKSFEKQTTFLSIDHQELILAPDTVCIHGDNPAALEILKQIKMQ